MFNNNINPGLIQIKVGPLNSIFSTSSIEIFYLPSLGSCKNYGSHRKNVENIKFEIKNLQIYIALLLWIYCKRGEKKAKLSQNKAPTKFHAVSPSCALVVKLSKNIFWKFIPVFPPAATQVVLTLSTAVGSR